MSRSSDDTLLGCLQQLADAGLWTPTPADVLDAERLLRSRPTWSPEALAASLASMLAHDEVRWQRIHDVVLARFRRTPLWEERRAAADTVVASALAGPARPWVAKRSRRPVLVAVLLVLAIVGVVMTSVSLLRPPAPMPEERVADGGGQGETPTATEVQRTSGVRVLPVEAGRLVGDGARSLDTLTWRDGMLALVSALLALVAARWWTAVERRREELRAATQEVEQKREAALPEGGEPVVRYHVERHPPFVETAMDDAATVLARLTLGHPSGALSIPPTVEQTVRRGGEPTFVFEQTRARHQLLVLVDLEAEGHPYLDGVEWVLARWRRGGVQLVRLDYWNVPENLRVEGRSERVTRDVVARRYEGAPLVLFTRLATTFEPGDPNLVWRRDLRAWPRRVWIDLDPREPGRWSDARKRLVEDTERTGLLRFPFTPKGLVEAAYALGDGPGGRWRSASVAAERGASAAVDERALMLWAGVASLVPDPTWLQLESLRRELPELARALPDRGCVQELIAWIRTDAQRHGQAAEIVAMNADAGPKLNIEDGHRVSLMTRLMQHAGERWPEEADREKRLEYQARRLLVRQLDAATVPSADVYEHEKQELKKAVHRVAMGELDLGQLLDRYENAAVAPELKTLVQELIASLRAAGDRRLRGEVVEEVEERLVPRAGARLGALLGWREWSWRAAGVVVAMVATSWGWWWVTQKQQVWIPPTFEVVEQEDVGCREVVALEGVAPMRMKCVPAGRFLMGSWPREIGSSEKERPQHLAEVGTLLVGETEVTQGQWKAVMGDTVFDCGYGCGEEYPAHSVSWNDAVEFMNRLTEKENELLGEGEKLTACYEEQEGSWVWMNKECTGYRLPTETEWEYVARAGSGEAYSFGGDATKLDEYAWYGQGSDGTTHPVGEKKTNAWGLYDVHGNVWEWVWDWYAKPYPSDSTARGYAGPVSGNSRVARGGSFDVIPAALRSAFRMNVVPTTANEYFGFRCVRHRTPVIWVKTRPVGPQ